MMELLWLRPVQAPSSGASVFEWNLACTMRAETNSNDFGVFGIN